MNRIHWKTTARHGELQVKEFDLEQTADAWIVLDLQRGIGAGRGDESTIESAIRVAAAISDKAIAENRAVGFTVNAGRTAFLPADRGGRQHQKIMQLLAAVEADGQAPLVETLISTVGRLRRGMTAVVITPSLDPSWVRPLASLRTRGVACVVVTFDVAAYDRGGPRGGRDGVGCVRRGRPRRGGGRREADPGPAPRAGRIRAAVLRRAARTPPRRGPRPMKRHVRLAPSEGWLTVVLVALLCWTLATSIDDVAPILGRDDFTDLLVPMAILRHAGRPRRGQGRLGAVADVPGRRGLRRAHRPARGRRPPCREHPRTDPERRDLRRRLPRDRQVAGPGRDRPARPQPAAHERVRPLSS